MTTPIGRAGKQVFSPLPPGQLQMRREASSQDSEGSAADQSPNAQSTSPPFPTLGMPRPSPPPPQRPTATKERRDSNDSVDLEKTLEQCKIIDQPISPLRNSTQGVSHAASTEDTPPFPQSAKEVLLNTSAYLSRAMSVKHLAEQTLATTGLDASRKVADLEKQELLAALEVLKMQNQMLSNRIEKNQNESRQQVEFERQQRLLAISSLERENRELLQKMIQSKVDAERKLEEEKIEFQRALQQVEAERDGLQSRLVDIENQSAVEIESLRTERSKMEADILKLEVAREQMYSRVLQIEAVNDSSILHSELDALRMHLQQVEMEKSNLQLQLQHNDQQLQDERHRLNERLEAERTLATKQLEAMEWRQSQAGQRLAQATATVQQQMHSMQTQMQQLQHLHSSDTLLLPAALEAPLLPAHTDPAHTAPAPESSSTSTKAEAKRKARALKEKLKARKTDRVAAGVSRMKASFEQEKKLRSQQSSNSNSVHDLHLPPGGLAAAGESAEGARGGGGGGGGQVALEAKQSLYDMFAGLAGLDHANQRPALAGRDPAAGEERYEIAGLPLASLVVPAAPAAEGGAAGGAAAQQAARQARPSRQPSQAARPGGQSAKTIMDLDSSDDEDDGEKRGEKTRGASRPVDAAGVDKAEVDEPRAVISQQPLSCQSLAAAVGTHTDGPLASPPAAVQGLPSAHAAAARGDLHRLKDLVAEDPSVLYSVDESQRSMIFYAAVQGHVNVLIYLLQLYALCLPEVFRYDIFGDSVVHAAVCSRNPVCVELLLAKLEKVYEHNPEEKFAVLNHRNQYGMTAVHMAGNVQCLEVLYKYGADVSIVDLQSRTPLFIFCLLNNEQCVNFLINSYDSIDYLYKADHRGDTPLHAAACNGSVECLLTLLSQGIDPRIVNTQNLRAVDLAIRNKQHKCRELLAEYLLHYSTSSDFDSVLFLACLEGHRYIAQNAYKLPGAATVASHGVGSPVPATSSPSPSTSPPPGTALPRLLHNQHLYPSLFTLRDAKTMRVQRFDKWIAYHDPYTGTVFWYHPDSGSGQWDVPAEVLCEQLLHSAGGQALEDRAPAAARGQETGESGGGDARSAALSDPSLDAEERLTRQLTSKLSMRMKRRGDWIKYSISGGEPIYYNERDGSFTWDDPHAPPPLVSSPSAPRHPDGAFSWDGETPSAYTHRGPGGGGEEGGEAVAYDAYGFAHTETPSYADSVQEASAAHDPSYYYRSAGAQRTLDVSGASYGTSMEDHGMYGYAGDVQGASHSVWQPFYDDSTGAIYWYHAHTGETQWENPYGNENDQHVLDLAMWNSRNSRAPGDDYEHHEAVPVENINDLGV